MVTLVRVLLKCLQGEGKNGSVVAPPKTRLLFVCQTRAMPLLFIKICKIDSRLEKITLSGATLLLHRQFCRVVREDRLVNSSRACQVWLHFRVRHC